jgi:hypothetical protein
MTRLALVGILALATACVPPTTTSAPAASLAPVPSSTATLVPGTCEYLGARFAVPTGFTVKEQREPLEPLARVTIKGELGRHQILLDVIPREAALYGVGATLATRGYFDSLRKAPFAAKWTDVREAQYPGPQRKYPALLAREPAGSSLGVDFRHDHIVLLYFPEVLGAYFYSFFWTDTHIAAEAAAPVTELEKLVDGFTVLVSPVNAPSRGCG